MQGKGFGERARALAKTMVSGTAETGHVATDEGRPPEWLTELDHHEGCEELAFTLYSDLGEVVEARTGKTAGSRDE
jgi:hypothetical protein